jgi:cell division protein FtsQ
MASTQKVPRLRVVKKKKRLNRRLIFLLFLFFMSLLLILFIRSSFGNISVLVKGNQWVSNEEIIKNMGIKSGSLLLFVDGKEMEQRIRSSFPLIQNVTIQKKYPATLEVAIKEKNVVAYLQKDSKSYPVFENGTLLSSRALVEPIVDKPRLNSWTNLNLLPTFIKELNQLEPEVKSLISEIVYKQDGTRPYSLVLYMKEGYEVRTTVADFAKNMYWYPSFVKSLKQDGNNSGIIYLSEVKYFEPYQTQ